MGSMTHDLDPDEIRRIWIMGMDTAFPKTKGHNSEQRIQIIRNAGGPRNAGNESGTSDAENIYCNFISASWNDLNEGTQAILRGELDIDESQEPVRVKMRPQE